MTFVLPILIFIYLPRSCLFPLFGHLIWLWISELPKKHLIYYCEHLTCKTYAQDEICISYHDIYLPRSCLFSLFGYLIWLWIFELPKKHLIYYCEHLTWKIYTAAVRFLNSDFSYF